MYYECFSQSLERLLLSIQLLWRNLEAVSYDPELRYVFGWITWMHTRVFCPRPSWRAGAGEYFTASRSKPNATRGLRCRSCAFGTTMASEHNAAKAPRCRSRRTRRCRRTRSRPKSDPNQHSWYIIVGESVLECTWSLYVPGRR